MSRLEEKIKLGVREVKGQHQCLIYYWDGDEWKDYGFYNKNSAKDLIEFVKNQEVIEKKDWFPMRDQTLSGKYIK